MTDLVAAERAFLGGVLHDDQAYWRMADAVTPEMLTVPLHADIYRAMVKIADRSPSITVAALLPHLPAEMPDEGPTVAILATLKANAADAGPADMHAEVIAERHAARQIADLGKWLTAQQGGARSSVELAEGVTARLRAIIETSETARPISIGSYARDVMASAARAYQTGAPRGITTGLKNLDAIMGGMIGGDLIFLMAAQSEGKSALAAQIAGWVATPEAPVLYVQLEMSGEDMAARALSSQTGVSVGHIRDGKFDLMGWDRARQAADRLDAAGFDIVDTDAMTVEQIQTMCQRQKRVTGLSLVVVDQLDKIKAVGRHRDRFERMAEITADLKRMAKTIDVPVMVLAQRTRGAQRRDESTPQILDADAPSIERDGDIVVAVWQHANWLRQNKPAAREGEEALTKWQAELFRAKGQADAITLKHRRGERFKIARMTFDGSTMLFKDEGGEDDLPIV